MADRRARRSEVDSRGRFSAPAPGSPRGRSFAMSAGYAYMGDDIQRELKFLGMTNSPSFVGELEGTGVAEWFIRTLS
jgi:hypothetical protein